MYQITIEECETPIESIKRETLKEARKAIRELIKKYTMIRHAGHIVNYQTHTELWTNF